MIYETRAENHHCRRYRETKDLKHIQWDYSSAYITLQDSLTICKIIQYYLPHIEAQFICFILLSFINQKIYYKYYGYDENSEEETMPRIFKNMHQIQDDADYPSPYTLVEVLDNMTSM